MFHRRLLAVALLAVIPVAAMAAATAPLSAEVIWQMKRVGAPALSPDGRNAVFPVTEYDVAENKDETDLYLVPTDGGTARRLTTAPGSDSSPAWSPDGRWIAFVAKRGDDKQSQLYLMPTDGGEAQRVGSVPTGVIAPKWFADSKRIAFISRIWPDLTDWKAQGERMEEREKSKMKALAWDRAPIAYWDHWLDDREAHVFYVPVEGGEPIAITRDTGLQLSRQEPGRGSYDIAPDGSEIVFAANVDKTGVDSNYDVFVVPVSGGAARNLTAGNAASDGSPQYSPDGRWLAYTRQHIKGFYGDTDRLVLVDRKSAVQRELTTDWDRSVDGLVWSPDSKALYGAIDDAGTQRVYRIDAATGRPTAVTKASSFSSLAIAGSPATLVAIRQSLSEPPTLVRVSTSDGAATQLSTMNDSLLKDVSFGRVESVTYEGAEQHPIQMWVVYPPGFDATKKYPLYLLLHGGPHNGVTDSWTFRWNAQVFASWGYVVAWHNFHGSSGFGQTFADSINPDRISLPYEDTIRAANWFQAQPWIDTERLVAGGGSYGGFLASTLLGREHPFKALVAHAAVYNEFTQYAADYGASKRRFFEFWEKPEEFARYSPHTSAGNFKTPTLVIVGQLDQRVPLNHGIELFNTLQNRGVESRLIYYPDENHWVLKSQNSLNWYQEVHDWLTKFAAPGAQ